MNHSYGEEKESEASVDWETRAFLGWSILFILEGVTGRRMLVVSIVT
jgi:hypothetical protein